MREIKFRAWDKVNKQMCYDLSTLSFSHEGYELTAGYYPEKGDYYELELLQFTGLKDKHGKHIYEGDIVRGLSKVGEVKFLETWSQWWVITNQDDSSFSLVKIPNHPEIYEVIGNIYENPNLLEDSK